MTHIGEDAVKAAASAGKVAVGRASLAKEKSFKMAQQVAGQAAVIAAPGIKKSQSLYSQHLKQHVDEKIIPVHKKHVAPVLVVLGRYQKVAKSFAQEFAEKVHSLLIAQFQNTCPKILRSLEKMNSKMDSSVPEVLIGHVEESCANPEESVNSFLRAALILLIIIFRSFLWRTTKRIVLPPIRFIWYFTPLRFFFKNRSGNVLDDDKVDDTRYAQIRLFVSVTCHHVFIEYFPSCLNKLPHSFILIYIFATKASRQEGTRKWEKSTVKAKGSMKVYLV